MTPTERFLYWIQKLEGSADAKNGVGPRDLLLQAVALAMLMALAWLGC